MKAQLGAILKNVQAELRKATALEELEKIRIKYLGRKGELTTLLHTLKTLPPDERPEFGAATNQAKNDLLQLLETRAKEFKEKAWSLAGQAWVDHTLPGTPLSPGRCHIINRVSQEIESIFHHLGFAVAEGPEVETEHYNFGAMNFPADHPSRDMHDTFFFSDKILLRTHTSPVQVRYMESHQPPLRVIMPGKTYRCDDDATHSPMFQQVEGLMIDEQISFANLKAVLMLFVQRMFGEDTRLRFRPSFFPFTEPSAEVDISCFKCGGQGCALCKRSGWIEILGAGMVHPQVLKAGRIDPEKYTGFAFGMGIERVAMLKYAVENIRFFYENDLRFLEQF